ncbi:PD-(D/E)XK nuclease superfamily protein [Shewanella morhuae]|uniref:PD-(D/E)XK nuclease superfamily protein n=1 Tax=Shewanella morhuae TaxID=365591 RepID=UPI0031344D37
MGSADQESPFLLESLRLAPEHNLVILLGGKGYKQKAFDWIKTAASNIQDKQIKIFGDLDEFISFFVSK